MSQAAFQPAFPRVPQGFDGVSLRDYFDRWADAMMKARAAA